MSLLGLCIMNLVPQGVQYTLLDVINHDSVSILN